MNIISNIVSSAISIRNVLMLFMWGGTFVAIPWFFLSYPVISIFTLLAMSCIFALQDKTWLLIIPLIYFVFPQQVYSYLDNFTLIASTKMKLSVMISILIVLYGLYNKSLFKILENSGLLLSSLLLFIVSVGYSVRFDNYMSLYQTMIFLIFGIFYYYTLKKSRISIALYFCSLDIVFYVLCCYEFLEYFWQISPYTNIYSNFSVDDFYDASDFFRPKSLCGHPLVLLGFLILHQTTLYMRLQLSKRSLFLYFSLVLSIFASILTLSRTAFIIQILLLLYWVALSLLLRGKLDKKILSLFVFFAVAVILSGDYLLQFVQLAFDRFNNSSISETNRLAAFQVAAVIFENEPFGVGANVADMFKIYKSSFDSKFELLVLDNSFLAVFCQFGVFVLLYFKLLLSPIMDVVKYAKRVDSIKYSIIVLVFSFCLLSFSFTIIKYDGFLLYYSSLLILHYHIMKQYILGNKNTVSSNYKLSTRFSTL